jgi:hypothetical protein
MACYRGIFTFPLSVVFYVRVEIEVFLCSDHLYDDLCMYYMIYSWYFLAQTHCCNSVWPQLCTKMAIERELAWVLPGFACCTQ